MGQGFNRIDPAQTDFQFLEELSTAYWYSQVLFTALELVVFGHLEKGVHDPEALADKVECSANGLARLLAALERMGLISRDGDYYYNNPAASTFLVPDRPDYMGDFFLYRQYMRPGWDALTEKLTHKLTGKQEEPDPDQDLSESKQMYNYTMAMDILVRQKAGQIFNVLKTEKISGQVLDIGGGAGSLARTLKELPGASDAYVFDLPDVIAAARKLYPGPQDWAGITTVGGDFRTYGFDKTFSLVCLSNFLHAYSAPEARSLLEKALSVVDNDGMVLIHDYFPDRPGAVPQKGPLYDLNMLVNTYNGVCHDAKRLVQWLNDAGFQSTAVKDLETDSALILAKRQGPLCLSTDIIKEFALELGFNHIIAVHPKDVVTAPWVRQKCRYGCSNFNKKPQCPPNGMDDTLTRRLLDSYSKAYLVRGTPPGHSFYKDLLALEKKAFLDGYHKAFVFGAGSCSVCSPCSQDGICRTPHLARPSMEGSGIDVYTTARNAGLNLEPVRKKGDYVTYLGLILVE